jgi:integrase
LRRFNLHRSNIVGDNNLICLAFLFTFSNNSRHATLNSYQFRTFIEIGFIKRQQFGEFLPCPRDRRRLPTVLSPEEVSRLINAAGTLFRRTLLITLYGTGMRRAELAQLKVSDIDSRRMIIRVAGKVCLAEAFPIKASDHTPRTFFRFPQNPFLRRLASGVERHRSVPYMRHIGRIKSSDPKRASRAQL